MNTIHVTAKSVYGNTLYYPVDDGAKALARLMGKKTFSRAELILAGELAHVVEVTKTPEFA